MIDDPEQRLLNGLADHDNRIQELERTVNDLTIKIDGLLDKLSDMDSLEKDNRSLKMRVGKLGTRVETLELLGLQEQIFGLNEKVNSSTESMLESERAFARFQMDFIQYHVCSSIDDKLSGQQHEILKARVKMQFAKSAEALKHSAKPLSLALEYRLECVKYSNEYGLNAFS